METYERVWYNDMHMKKRTLIIILGVWIAIIPILGLPNVWKNRMVSVSALVLVYLAYSRKVAPAPMTSSTNKNSADTTN